MTKPVLAAVAGGIVLGLLLMGLYRFASYSPQRTHYHANFAVYINGKREAFKGPQYYQDVAACSAFEHMTPLERTHMHNNVSDIVHVHDEAVTWQDFFVNLGWLIDPDFIKTDTQLYQADDTHHVTFMLNGDELPDVGNTVIKDDDRLLVSYGDDTEAQLHKQFKSIASTAHEHDVTQDPASCSGNIKPTTSDRLKHIFSNS